MVDGTDGGLAANYSLAIGQIDATAAVITTKALTAAATAADKAYDGNTTAISTLTLSGSIGSETLTTSGVGSTFNSANVADATTVTVNSATLVDGSDGLGGLATNYSLATGQIDATAAVITPKALIIIGMTAANKDYDGNLVATVSGGSVITGVPGEFLNLSNMPTLGVFADKNVGINIGIKVNGGAVLSNTVRGLASNYSLVLPTDLIADIADIADITVPIVPPKGCVFATNRLSLGARESDNEFGSVSSGPISLSVGEIHIGGSNLFTCS